MSYQINNNVSVGANISSSATEGVSVNPSVTVSMVKELNEKSGIGLSASLGMGYNSRQGLQNYSLTGSTAFVEKATKRTDKIMKNDFIEVILIFRITNELSHFR